jgi:ABC-type transport system substrate-binding protein
MRTSANPRPLFWLVPASVLTLLLVALGGWLLAQGKSDQKPGTEKEESPAPVIKKRLPDEGDDDGARSKVPTPVGEGEPDKKGPRPEKPGALKPADLAALASRTKNSDLQEFYLVLAVPHDLIHKPAGGVSFVEPIPRYLGKQPHFRKPIRVRILRRQKDGTFKQELQESFSPKEVESVEHYEQFAIRMVNEFLAQKTVTRPLALRSAEKALSAVIGYFDAARESGERDGDEWDRIGRQLRNSYRDIKLDQLRDMPLRDQQEWEAASEFGDDLQRLYPDDVKVQAEIANIQLTRAHETLKKKGTLEVNDFMAVRMSLERLERQAPNSEEARKIRAQLESEAGKLLSKARAELEGKNPDRRALATRLLKDAEQIWPRLPGLRDEQLRLQNSYPILYVGVRHLPEKLWPGAARLDSERQAVEMLYESLIRPHLDPDLGLTYELNLSAERPRLIPLGRQFDLIRNAYWNDGTQVTAADVQHTLEMLRTPDWVGYRPELKDLVDKIFVGSDPFRVNLNLHQGYLDPLALMTFKVLPDRQLLQLDAWKQIPVPLCSGPFQYKEKRDISGRAFTVFEANPYYRGGNQPNLPRIREIHFFHSTSPASDFKTGHLHVLLHLPTDQIKDLQDDQILRGKLTIQTMRNRRIYFLAINHRKPALKGLDDEHADLRRAINHAIDREHILNQYFRDGTKYHRALTGAYPPESWACNPKVGSQFHSERAKLEIERSKLQGTELTVSFPDDDPRVEQACEYIKQSLERIGLKIKRDKLTPEELYRKVELEQNYDLAFYHWDYPSEDYWLAPLLDPRPASMQPGGPNFMGYQNDGQLQPLFQQAMAHREFKTVRRLTHEIHMHLFDSVTGKVPFIPLWQLDTHIAYVNDLQPVGLDPLLVFTHVDQWRLEKR